MKSSTANCLLGFFLLLTLSLSSFFCKADYAGNLKVKKLFGNGSILFGVSTPPPNTCDYFGRHFKFDATTDGGKNLLSILLAAHLSDKNVDVWYLPSKLPGSSEDNGCNPHDTLAVVTQIGFAN
ncbi:hypothetical protein [Alteromonas mediterranea]|uniref:hypothetical protein n=1 Tax=Alteromonas mediterranea TaxID=314275 RepID=UPI0012DB7440|nr:hypothetical protein [Alteromonas mediterranea]